MRRLAVVVLNWNGLRDTLALLDSLQHCRTPEGWSAWTIVVDNASSDGSPEALAARSDVELLRMPSNLRFAGGNNAGIKRALGQGADAVMLLNNDTVADPGLLERLLLALDQDPGAGAAGPLIYYAPPSDVIWYAGGVCVPSLALVFHRGIGRRDRGQYRAVEPTGYITGCCLLAPRAVWERVGLLDEGYFLYAEDSDWCLRARRLGYRLLFVPTARLWHLVSAASGGERNPWKIYHRARSNVRLFSAHARGAGRLTWLPGCLATQAATSAALLLRGHAAAAAAVPRALIDAARSVPAAEAMP